MSWVALWERARTDAAIGIRALRTNVGFTLTVVLSLALAIGAASSAFSVVDAIRFRALPFADADRLVLIAEVPENGDCGASCNVAFVTYQRTLANRAFRTFTSVAAHVSGIKSLTTNGESEPVLGTLATDNLFPMLAATPMRGRPFTTEDNTLGAAPVVILSYDLWATRFGENPSVIGERIQLSDTRYTVVGIMPRGFDFESGSRFWLPAVPSLDPSTRPSIRAVTVLGHLAPGATIEQARAELAGVSLSLSEGRDSKATVPLTLTALPLRTRYTAATQGYDLIFFSVVLAVVLIACANLTNLLLARGLDQRREFAVRAALGAEPRRLAAHVLAQHGMLAVAGTLLGLLFARAFLGIVRSVGVLNSYRPTAMDYRIDSHAAAFAALISAMAIAVMSIVPLRLVLAADPQDVLREATSSGAGGRGGTRVQRTFVAAQVAFAVPLLIAAGLTVRSAVRVASVDVGFDPVGLLQTSPSFPHDWRVKETYVGATQRIESVLRAIPGVVEVATRAANPLGSARAPAEITLAGDATPLPRGLAPSNVLAVDSSYFSTLRIALVHGRVFGAEDREQSNPVAVVNQWAATHWWKGADPIGAKLRIDTLPGQSITVTIVGVVHDNRASSGILVAEGRPELYRPITQAPSAFPTFYVRTSAAPAPLIRAINTQLGPIVLNRPVSTTLAVDALGRQLSGVATTARQILAFAIVGLLLAVVGVYGVLSYSVKRRSRELGIRRALGATASGVYRLVLRDALVVVSPGIVVALFAAVTLGRFMTPLLHGVSPTDALTFGAIVGTVLATSILSALAPALRAARVSPLTAIRNG